MRTGTERARLLREQSTEVHIVGADASRTDADIAARADLLHETSAGRYMAEVKHIVVSPA